VINALQNNISFPPTGQSTGIPEGFTSVAPEDLECFSDIMLDEDGLELTCQFSRQVNLGLRLQMCAATDDIIVVAFVKLHDGSAGPAQMNIERDRIRPGDLIKSCSCDLIPWSQRIGKEGEWIAHESCMDKSISFSFTRASRVGEESDKHAGGRPKKRVAKTTSEAGNTFRLARKARRGGASNVKNTKPQKTRASAMKKSSAVSATDRLQQLLSASYLLETADQTRDEIETMVYVP